jgi:hypothetical protein
MLPALAIAAWARFGNFKKAMSVVLVFAATFSYLRSYSLGMPDPLAITLLILAALQEKPSAMLLCIALASLTHFTMTLVATAALGLLVGSSAIGEKRQRLMKAMFAILGLALGKLFLSMWYLIFSYHFKTRLDWVLQHGLAFFCSPIPVFSATLLAAAWHTVSGRLYALVLVLRRRAPVSLCRFDADRDFPRLCRRLSNG